MKSKDIKVVGIDKGSIAEEAGIEPGDILLSINGNRVYDIIEYRFLVNDEELTLGILKANGEEWEIEIEKEAYEDLGMNIEDPSMENPKGCHNKCIFCFIDQLPKGMRESLYFKDDDSRLSFLHGNFITLTNMKAEDIDRLIKYRISPINVSIHTTNPELRVKMLNNKKAGEVIASIKKLTQGGIQVNCQIVLCPKVNDGKELQNTIEDLYSLYPGVQNVAIVPVGITKYRDGLYEMEGYNRQSASEVIDLVHGIQNRFLKETGETFARLADEFYINAERELPSFEDYGDFEQLEDGIGMIRYFENCINEDLANLVVDGKGLEFAVVTGVSSYEFIKKITSAINEKLNINIKVYKIINNFFGEKITVSGLLTGRDIIDQLKGKIKEKVVFIPSNMLKADQDIFLDDITLEDIMRELNIRVEKCKYSGDDFIDKIVKEVF